MHAYHGNLWRMRPPPRISWLHQCWMWSRFGTYRRLISTSKCKSLEASLCNGHLFYPPSFSLGWLSSSRMDSILKRESKIRSWKWSEPMFFFSVAPRSLICRCTTTSVSGGVGGTRSTYCHTLKEWNGEMTQLPISWRMMCSQDMSGEHDNSTSSDYSPIRVSRD